jgi:hypothetical protein
MVKDPDQDLHQDLSENLTRPSKQDLLLRERKILQQKPPKSIPEELSYKHL